MKDYRHMVLGGTILLAVALFAMAEDDPQIGDKPLSELLKQLKSENRGFQLRAAQSLAKAPTNLHARIVPQLIPILKSERENDRFVAAQTLGEYGTAAKAAVPSLLPMLEGTQYERNRAAAAKALGQILEDAQPSEEVEKVTVALTCRFNTGDEKYSDVRRESVRALGMIGPAAKSCIPKLGMALTDHVVGGTEEHKLVRRAAAWTCGQMGPLAAEHMDRLIAMMLGGDEVWVPEVVEAIGKIGPINENIVPNIVNHLEEAANHGWIWGNGFPDGGLCTFGSAATKALQRFGPKAAPAVPFLMRVLPEKSGANVHPVVLIEVIRTLGAIGPAAKDAIPRLEAMTKAGNSAEAQEAARQALAAIKGEKK